MTKTEILNTANVTNNWDEITVTARVGEESAEISCGYTPSLNWVITTFKIPKVEHHRLIASTLLGKLQALVQMKVNFTNLILDTEEPSLYSDAALLRVHGFTKASWADHVLTWRQRGFKVRLVSAQEINSNPDLSLLAQHYFNDQGNA